MQRKLKRKLTDISFEHDTAHIALVSKDQNGPANGHDYAMVLKSRQFSPEFIEKAQRVKVELEIPEFLKLFYGIWCEEDQKSLAKLMGWVDYEEMLDGVEEVFEGDRTVEMLEVAPADYVRANLQDTDMLLEMAGTQDLAALLASLSEEQFLAFLQAQEQVEKAVKTQGTLQQAIEKQAAKAVSAQVAKQTLVVKKQTTKPKQKEQLMQKQDSELVEKSALAAVQKALDEQKQEAEKQKLELEAAKQTLEKANEQHRVELQKALDAITEFKLKEKQAVAKARLELVKAAVKDDAKAAVLFKAVGLVEDEAEFTAVVKALAEMQAQVEKSALFQEQGTQLDEADVVQESAVARVLKSRIAK